METSALQLSTAEMRRFGYAVIDALVEHFAAIASQPPGRKAPRQELEPLFRESLPEAPEAPGRVLELALEGAFRNTMHVDHPRFFAFVPSPGNFAGAMADALASGFNSFVGTWFAGSGAAEVELVTIDWLRQICGFPDTAGGLFVSGGSVANLTALAIARRRKLGTDGQTSKAVVYYSDQTHSAVDRALDVLGFRPSQIRKLPSDGAFRLPLPALRDAIALDRQRGLAPFCVVANAGTTNTGAVDPLIELAAICRQEDLWLHADGAYGAAAMVCQRGRGLLDGIQLVDSLALDPHKWLFQPFEIGCVLIRNERDLKDTFRITPEYLRDVHRLEEEVNFCDRGIQLTRSFRALKLWMTFKIFGLNAIREAVDWGFHLAEVAEQALQDEGCFEIVSPANMATICFRFAAPGRTDAETDRLTEAIVHDVLESGYAIVTSTALSGRPVLRLCTINPRTTEADIRGTVKRIADAGRRRAAL